MNNFKGLSLSFLERKLKKPSKMLAFGRFAFTKCINDLTRRLTILSFDNDVKESSPSISIVIHLSE